MVYVDFAKNKLGRMLMCHMVADSEEELILMAKKIGVAERHHQFKGEAKSHFDICQQKRQLAVSLGAKEVSSKKIVEIIRCKRLVGGE